jgi:hypothetical protein
MVSRLSGMEAVSLHTESSTVPAHAVALIIIEASDQLSHQRLRELVGSALPQLARFRCRLVGKPLGLGQPVWAEIDGYDPTSQIHSATVPAPGGRREFAELIAWLTTGPLDADALRQLYAPAVGGSIPSTPTINPAERRTPTRCHRDRESLSRTRSAHRRSPRARCRDRRAVRPTLEARRGWRSRRPHDPAQRGTR